MPKTAKRFCAFLTVLILFQLLAAAPNILAGTAYGMGQLVACLLWVVLAGFTLQGSHGARKFIVFLTCLGLGSAGLGLLGGVVLLATEGPLGIIPIIAGLFSLAMCGGLLKFTTDDRFCSWVTHKAIERANAKLAIV